VHVLILDPHSRVRDALQNVLEDELGADVTVGATLATVNGPQVFDVLVVDERVAGAYPSEEREQLKELSKLAPVVVMGLGERVPYEDAHVAAGAAGYWPKDDDLDALLALVRAAALVERLHAAA